MKRRKAGVRKRTLSKEASKFETGHELPLIHVTTVGGAREILSEGQLSTERCSVFGKELLYFFLARPDYRFKHGDEKREFLSFFPVVLVFDPASVPVVYHVYPFDTGGAVAGLFDDLSDPYTMLEDYELSPNLDAAHKHVSWAFGSIENYLDGNILLKAGDVPAFSNVVQSFVSIAGMASQGSNKPDKRASAVEIASQHNVILKSNLRKIIVPAQMLSDAGVANEDLVKTLKELDVDVELYDWQPNLAPNEILSNLREVVLSEFRRDE